MVSREEAILDIPPIVVVEAVDVDIPLTAIVPVDIQDRDTLYNTPSDTPPLEIPMNDLRIESNFASFKDFAR